MEHIVTKFGGTSVSSRETWEKILLITKQHSQNGVQPIIVCSALTQASNQLEKAIEAALINQHEPIQKGLINSYLNLADALEVDSLCLKTELKQLQQWLKGIALLKEASPKIRAQILSLGEIMMTRLGFSFLQANGINCLWFDVRNALVSTPLLGGDSINYLAARCKCEPNANLASELLNTKAQAVITQGFFAANPEGETVLLGRGGSDTSAALLAAILQAKTCEIWTDVPGIYTANPYELPEARLLKQLNYDEAQEIASMGAKVLHPNCLPPVRQANIPMIVKFTKMPEHSGTRISKESDINAPPIKSIQIKNSVLLISIDTINMWQQVGFLADVFVTIKQHGFSVDLLSSSESNVTFSLDSTAKLRDRLALDDLIMDLNRFGRAKLIEPCSAVSLVGHHIRTILPELGPTLELFESQQIYLMSLASNDLNLTFVVNETQADKLCQKLHHLLIENNPQSFYYSKSWQEEFGINRIKDQPWWEKERLRLLSLAEESTPCYVYHLPTQANKADELKNLKSIDKLFYAIKANPHAELLMALYNKGFGFECVSIQELKHVLGLFPGINPHRILFTPNFAERLEYEFALNVGCHVTIDNLYPLENWTALFVNKSILLRLDPGSGAGHHKYVSTGGNESKFGIPKEMLPTIVKIVQEQDINVMGLHAHSGSGILTPLLWQKTALFLTSLIEQFPKIEVINLGGGLGIVDKPGQHSLDLSELDNLLLAVKTQFLNLSFWLEPGRYLVAESGVLLTSVTQSKEKGRGRFIGVNTGMNSLIRPSLYGAYHEIVNLTRIYDEKTGFAHVVGPICESGDTLGYDRLLPHTEEKDVMLIANVGAYGHCMSSYYNLREPAQEIIMD